MKSTAYYLIVSLLLFTPTDFISQTTTWYPVITATMNQSEPQIAAKPTNADSLMSVWIDYRASNWAGYGFSSNGGVTWDTGVITDLPDGNISQSDPSCSYNRDGSAFDCFTAYHPAPNYYSSIWVSRTTNCGASWHHKMVFQGSNDKPWMTINNKPGGINWSSGWWCCHSHIRHRRNRHTHIDHSIKLGCRRFDFGQRFHNSNGNLQHNRFRRCDSSQQLKPVHDFLCSDRHGNGNRFRHSGCTCSSKHYSAFGWHDKFAYSWFIRWSKRTID